MFIFIIEKDNYMYKYRLQISEMKNENDKDEFREYVSNDLGVIRVVERWKKNEKLIYDYVNIPAQEHFSNINEILSAYFERCSDNANNNLNYQWAVVIRALDGQAFVLDPPVVSDIVNTFSAFASTLRQGIMSRDSIYLRLSSLAKRSRHSYFDFINKYKDVNPNELVFSDDDKNIVETANFLNSLKIIPLIYFKEKLSKITTSPELYEMCIENTKELESRFYSVLSIVDSVDKSINESPDKILRLCSKN